MCIKAINDEIIYWLETLTYWKSIIIFGIKSVKIIFHKSKFFLHQGSFLQVKIYPSWRKFSTIQNFSFIKEVFLKQKFFLSWKTFSTNKVFPFIKEVFHKDFLTNKIYSTSKDFFMIKKVFLKESLLSKEKIFHLYST